MGLGDRILLAKVLILFDARARGLAEAEAARKLRGSWSRAKRHQALTNCQDYFKNDTLALIGYGSQGHGQGLNLRDNGLNVIVGVRKNGASWKEAQQDGWVVGKNLFEVDEAIGKGTIVMNLLSDAAQSETWPAIKPQLTKGKVRTCLPVELMKFSLTDLTRLCTSPMASPPSSRISPRLTSLPISTSSSLRPRAPVERSDRYSRKVEASTPPSPSSRM